MRQKVRDFRVAEPVLVVVGEDLLTAVAASPREVK
jgi:hypothetical protein